MARKRTGVLIVLLSLKDESKTKEFHRWYDDIHIPNVLRTRMFYAARRYSNPTAKPGAPKYLSIYETDVDEPLKALEMMLEKKGETYIFPGLNTFFVGTFQNVDADKIWRTAYPTGKPGASHRQAGGHKRRRRLT